MWFWLRCLMSCQAVGWGCGLSWRVLFKLAHAVVGPRFLTGCLLETFLSTRQVGLSTGQLTTQQLAPSEVTHYHFCHMLLAIQTQPWYSGEGTTQGCEYQGVGGIGNRLWGLLPQAELEHFVSVENSIFENFPDGCCSVHMAFGVFENYFLYVFLYWCYGI